jgi:1-acyl-sn-glycerol-3-phosphate acyltransferase
LLTYIKLFLLILYSIILSVTALISSLVDRSFKSYFVISKIFSWGILTISGIELKITGLDNFDRNGVYVFVSNHSSQFDIPAMQLSAPLKLSIVYKKELGKIPLFGWQLRTGPYIMIDRKNVEEALKSIEKAKKTMQEKRFSVILFAEGTRSKTGEIQPFKRGAFNLASKVNFPVIPVTIYGTQKILPKGKLKIKPGTIYLHFDKPVSTENIKSRSDELALMENVRDIIVQNYERMEREDG